MGDLSNKVIVTVAQTGAITMKKQNPHVPEQPDEIAASALACYNEGAAVVHIHARDTQGGNTSDVAVFNDIHKRIRAVCPLVIEDSTGGGPNLTQEQRLECLQAGPEMASLNMGTMMRISGQWKGIPWSNMPEEIDWYLGRMNELGIKPELEVYSHAMMREVYSIIERGLLKAPYYIDVVLGMRYQGACDATPKIFTQLVDLMPQGTIVNCAAVGRDQVGLTTLSILMGGHARVGLEDNIYYGKGDLATNARLVARTVRIIRELGKEPATPDEARQILGLKPLVVD
jgi:3-keto-5-aminohexanoate cleavage enzyme